MPRRPTQEDSAPRAPARSPVARARRPGYSATATSAVGRRGAHTRNQIKAQAVALFIANGYHATSVEEIARAVGGSRATIYQYFTSKEDIYAELVRECEDAVLEHARTLTDLGPDAQGLRNLSRWLHEWADIYDIYAVVFLEFPGIGIFENIPVTDAGPVAEELRTLITDRVTGIGITPDLDPRDAAAALLRISHMVNLYRYRGLFDLPSRTATSDALAITLQLMLFPDTPTSIISARCGPQSTCPDRAVVGTARPRYPAVTSHADDSPVRQDVLSVSSTLFAERGYYSVSMDEVAAAAGISRATLYRHFNSKVKILAELTGHALAEIEPLANELNHLAATGPDLLRLHAWMIRYTGFHRRYNGVIRAGFDGAVTEQLSDITLSSGIHALHVAVTAVLDRTRLPGGMDQRAAAAIFLAILGRMTEPTAVPSSHGDAKHTAALMMLILQRSLLRSLEAGEG